MEAHNDHGLDPVSNIMYPVLLEPFIFLGAISVDVQVPPAPLGWYFENCPPTISGLSCGKLAQDDDKLPDYFMLAKYASIIQNILGITVAGCCCSCSVYCKCYYTPATQTNLVLINRQRQTKI